MKSRRTESAPANVATEIMQPAVIKVSPSLLADLNPLVTTAPLARIRKPTRAMINTSTWWPPSVITFVNLEVWSSQVPTAIIQATATMSSAVTSPEAAGVAFRQSHGHPLWSLAAALLPPPGDEWIPEAQLAVPGWCGCDDAEDDRVEDADNGVDADC